MVITSFYWFGWFSVQLGSVIAGLNYCYDKGFNFVVFLDSDDYLFPHALARLYREINLNGADIASANFCVENDKGKNLLTQAKNKTFVHGKMYRTAFLKENNIAFSSLRTNEDLAFNLKAMNSTSKIHFMDEELQLFHDDAQSITRSGENCKNLAIDYMEAIYEACVFLKNKNISIEDMFLNIVNCYNVYQIFLLLDGKPTNEHKEHIRWLLSQDTFKKQLTESIKLNKISEMVNQMSCINGKLKQFKQTFLQWLEEFESENSSN